MDQATFNKMNAGAMRRQGQAGAGHSTPAVTGRKRTAWSGPGKRHYGRERN